MDAKDPNVNREPIKETEEKVSLRIDADSAQLDTAFALGTAQGYQRAVQDFILFLLLAVVWSILLREISTRK